VKPEVRASIRRHLGCTPPRAPRRVARPPRTPWPRERAPRSTGRSRHPTSDRPRSGQPRRAPRPATPPTVPRPSSRTSGCTPMQ
jgi:hypothetical protein